MGARETVGGGWLSSPMTTTAIDLDTPAGVLAFARDSVARTYAAEVDKLHAAIAWAAMHSVDSMDDAACYPGFEAELALAGPGAPLVAEFAVAELAVALRVSTDAGRAFLGLAMELRYRLPRVWKRVTAGDLAPWRARKVAEQTMCLSMEAAGFVDAHVAAFAHKISDARLERLVEEAVTRFMPAEAEERRRAAAEHRHFDIHTRCGAAPPLRPPPPPHHRRGRRRRHRHPGPGRRPRPRRRRHPRRRRPQGPRLRGAPRRPPLAGGRGDGTPPAHPRPQHRPARRDRFEVEEGAAGR